MPVNYNFPAASEKEQKTHGRTFFWLKKLTKQKNQIPCSINSEAGRGARQWQGTSAVLQNHVLSYSNSILKVFIGHLWDRNKILSMDPYKH